MSNFKNPKWKFKNFRIWLLTVTLTLPTFLRFWMLELVYINHWANLLLEILLKSFLIKHTLIVRKLSNKQQTSSFRYFACENYRIISESIIFNLSFGKMLRALIFKIGSQYYFRWIIDNNDLIECEVIGTTGHHDSKKRIKEYRSYFAGSYASRTHYNFENISQKLQS